jgi:hypothetical protein
MALIGDIDYIIMTNANEDSLLWELLYEYKKEYPGLSAPVALNNLMTRLAELVSEGKVGIYSAEAGCSYESPEEYQDLKITEALAVINEEGSWGVPAADTAILNYLWARDENYFSEYYEPAKK